MNRFNRHRRDSVHAEIVETLEALGCSVRDCSQLGDSGPDITVGLCGHDFPVELKSENGQLSDAQVEWNQAWRGAYPTVLRSRDEALSWVNDTRSNLSREDLK